MCVCVSEDAVNLRVCEYVGSPDLLLRMRNGRTDMKALYDLLYM